MERKVVLLVLLVMCSVAVTCQDEEIQRDGEPDEQVQHFRNSLSSFFERFGKTFDRNQTITGDKNGILYVWNIKNLSLIVTNAVPKNSDIDKLQERITKLENSQQQTPKSQKESQINTKKPETDPKKVLDPCKTANSSGVYKSPLLNKFVYCEMESYGGGWLVIQQRFIKKDGSHLRFDRTWVEYREGFGNVWKDSDFWLGLEAMHQLTQAGDYELTIEMKNETGQEMLARYLQCKVAGEGDKYRLTVGDYHGSVVDKMGTVHNNLKFSTKDNDNDNSTSKNCAFDSTSGWWFSDCASDSNLNNVQPYWATWGSGNYSRIMIRRI